MSRDFYWKQGHPGWEVWTERDGAHSRIEGLWFWRWRTAARVTQVIFASYLDGQDVGKKRAAMIAEKREEP